MQNTGPILKLTNKMLAQQPGAAHSHVLDIRLTNLTLGDLRFLQGVISLFADPQSADGLAELRKGAVVIEREQYSGEMFLSRPAQPFGQN